MIYDGQVITDSLGRSITLRKPSVLDQYYLSKSLGEDSKNPACFNMMFPIIHVAKIDNQILEVPMTYPECLAALKRLEIEGINAVIDALDKFSKSGKEQIEDVKKS